MAIHSYCEKCYTSNSKDAKSCSNCGAVFGRSRRYRVCVSEKGERQTRVVDNLTLAQEVESALKGDAVRGEFGINRGKKKKKTITLGELWNKYLSWAKVHKKSWLNDLRYYRLHLEPRFGKKGLDAISPIDVERMKTEMKKGLNKRGKPFAAATIKHQIVILRRLYNLARKWGLYQGKSPIESVTMPKLDNQQTEFLTNEELTRLLDTLDNWPFAESAALVKFALFTGLRRGEIFKLRWDDVDFERGLITLKDPKSGKTESVPVSLQALDVLKSLEVTSPFVFPGKGGKQRVEFNGPWQKIRQAAGLPSNFRFHGLRHHFASTLVSNGVDLLVVQRLLTHKDSKTTARYAHLAPGAIRDAALKSGELLILKKAESNFIALTD
ncbi:MAG: site-specific integrase [Deltaproteobacteria bacterium]|nr:site-specific integrase [Deltaproteobacteria bacterium]